MSDITLDAPISFTSRLKSDPTIARVDHWTKNIFILPASLSLVSLDHS